MTEEISVLLVDDHRIFRQGLMAVLTSMPEIRVIGEAGNGIEAGEKARELQPDLVIIDISMPEMLGIGAIKEIKRVSTLTKILVLSMHKKEEYIKQSLKNGASGYMLKESAADELFTAIRCILKGEIYLSPAASKSIVANWLLISEDANAKISSPLTTREIAILKLLAESHTNKEIAKMLHISPKTVETHRFRIMEKLEFKNLADLVKYAIRNELTNVD